jgi:hypothetical protein
VRARRAVPARGGADGYFIQIIKQFYQKMYNENERTSFSLNQLKFGMLENRKRWRK